MVHDDDRHVAILRRLAELSPIGLPVQIRALADGFVYERANGHSVLRSGGRIPEWFVSAVDQLVSEKLIEPADSMWAFAGTPSSPTGAATRAFCITDAGRRTIEQPSAGTFAHHHDGSSAGCSNRSWDRS